MRYFNQEKTLEFIYDLTQVGKILPSINILPSSLVAFVEKLKAKCEYADRERDIFLLLSFLLLENHEFEPEN